MEHSGDHQMEFYTDDLLLRTATERDIKEIARMWEYPREITVEAAYQALRYMETTHSRNRPKEICHLCLGIFRKEEPEVIIGWCGLDGEAEPGKTVLFYMIDESFRNRGYATQCAAELLRYAFEDMAYDRIYGGCAADNLSSYRVMKKVGMVQNSFYENGDYIFSIEKESFLDQKAKKTRVIAQKGGAPVEQNASRVMLAGVSSGCGKTTVTCAVLQALVDRRLRVGAFKCGPDYIDPMFHSRIIGAKSANLDLFFFSENTLRHLLARNSREQDISVIEGVMGYYDGAGLTSTQASSWETARATDTPVVLIVSAKGAALSVLAVIQGFLDFQPDSRICGVILNRCTAMTYQGLAKAVRERFGGRVEPLGYLPEMPDCMIESRHLGLVTAAEIGDLREKLHLLSGKAEETIDLDRLLELARNAPPLVFEPVKLPQYDPVRIGVAKDRAFCFYYEDSLEALREMGAELIEFSPLEDAALPEGLDGLYLGGGYPELYAEKLAGNESMRRSICQTLENGLPCIAECGGFMYLTQMIGDEPMVGFLPGRCWDNHKLTRFGYVKLRARKDNLLCRAGEEIRGHEFHHWDAEDSGGDFTAEKLSGKRWECVFATDRLYAGYPHFHFYSNLEFAKNFYEACLREKNYHAGND